MRVACLVLACKAPTVLGRTLPVYNAAGWDVFIHLDAKVARNDYICHLGREPYQLVEDPELVFWGGYSMLRAEFKLLDLAQRSGPYDKYLLISDDTLPLFPPERLNKVISQEGDLFTATAQGPNARSFKEYYGYYHYDHFTTALRRHGNGIAEIDESLEQAVLEIAELRKVGKKKLTLFYGSQFWALTQASIDVVTHTLSSDTHLVNSFKYAPLPDETMIQTILGNSILNGRGIAKAPVYADFHSQNGGPRILDSIRDLPFDLDEYYIFARKAAPGATAFVQTVVNRLLNGMSAWGLPPDELYSGLSMLNENDERLPVFTFKLCAPGDGDSEAEWNGIETYLQRPFRWTKVARVNWVIEPALPPGRSRFFLPLAIGRYAFGNDITLDFNGQTKRLGMSRASLLVEFDHGEVPAGTLATLSTPEPVVGLNDTRALGIGVWV